MRKEEDTFDRYIRLEELHEMEAVVPMTLSEREKLRRWVYSGHGVDSNPWKYREKNGYEMNYLDAWHRHLKEIWGEFYRPFYLVVPVKDSCKLQYPDREDNDEWDLS